MWVKYAGAGEDLFHELLAGWHCGDGEWVIGTADDDMYVLDLLGVDVEKFFITPPGRDRPGSIRGGNLHRFQSPPSQRALRNFIIGAKTEAEAHCRAAGTALPAHDAAYVWDGSRVSMADLMATPRRLNTKTSAPVLPVRAADDGRAPGGGAGSSNDPGGPGGPSPKQEEKELEEGALREGFVWLLVEHSVLGDIGMEVDAKDVKKVEKDKGIAHIKKGHFSEHVFCRQVEIDDAANFIERLKEDWRKILGQAKEEPGEVRTPPAQEDARTLAVRFDEHGERWRDWKVTVGKSEENFYEDWPLEGPKTVLWLMKHVDRTGGAPMAWYHRFLSEARISATDRSAYELQTLARMMELAACYDQLNLPSLACFEVLSRRWQLLLDANSRDLGDPKFEDEKLWAG